MARAGTPKMESLRSSSVKHQSVSCSKAMGWKLMPEARNDEVLWSYEPMDPWHLAFTPGVRPLEVKVDGEVVFADGKTTKVDADEVRAKAREQAARLHAKL